MRFRKGLDKNTGSAHFRSQRMHHKFTMQVCIKIYKKTPGVATPGPPRREVRHLFAPTPVPTRQMLVPLRFSWAGYGPGPLAERKISITTLLDKISTSANHGKERF